MIMSYHFCKLGKELIHSTAFRCLALKEGSLMGYSEAAQEMNQLA